MFCYIFEKIKINNRSSLQYCTSEGWENSPWDSLNHDLIVISKHSKQIFLNKNNLISRGLRKIQTALFYFWSNSYKNYLYFSLHLNKRFFSGLGICSSVFWANCSFFAQNWANERFAQKNEQFTHSLTFGERPEQIAHGHSFLVSDLSDSLTSLIFGIFIKHTKKQDFRFY